jgi:Mn-dependent DtxR family transcriptional regulator
MTGFAPARSVNSAKMAFFVIEEAMKRDQMLMEAILGQLLQSPEPLVGTSSIAQRLNVELPVVRHHLNLLQDKGLVQESENGVWRLTNQGHDYMEGTPEQGIALNLPSK